MQSKVKRNRDVNLFIYLTFGFTLGLCTLAKSETTTINWDDFQAATSTPSVEEVFSNVRTCGSNLSVSFNASLIHFPKSNESEAVHCRWFLTAPAGHKIAISSVYASYNFPAQFVHWIAFDGDDPTKAEKILSYTELRDRSIEGDWLPGLNDNPIISSSNKMVIDYISFGNAPLEAKLLFYSCGGTIYGHGSVKSPVFSYPDYVGTRLLLQCKWELIMEKESHFASIQMRQVNVRDDCSVINVATNGIMKYILPKGSNNTVLNQAPDDTMSVMNECGNVLFVSKSQDKTSLNNDGSVAAEKPLVVSAPTAPTINNSAMFICGKNIMHKQISNQKLFVSGTRTVLEYTLPCLLPDVGFEFYFQSYSHYSSMLQLPQKKIKQPPVYVTYAGILIWTPIGGLLGLLIICCHMHRRASKNLLIEANIDKIETSAIDSTDQANNRRDVVDQVTSANTPVIKSIIKGRLKRKKSCGEIEEFITSSTALTSECNTSPKNVEVATLVPSSKIASFKQSKLRFSKHVKFKHTPS